MDGTVVYFLLYNVLSFVLPPTDVLWRLPYPLGKKGEGKGCVDTEGNKASDNRCL